MWEKIKTQLIRFKYWIIFGVLGTGIALAAFTVPSENIEIPLPILEETKTESFGAVACKDDDTKTVLNKLSTCTFTKAELSNFKGEEIAKIVSSVARQAQGDYDIEIVSTEPIEGGIAVFVRAWTRGKSVNVYKSVDNKNVVDRTIPANTQIGFGVDGTIDIERIQIFISSTGKNKHLTHFVVPDLNGNIEIEYLDENGNPYIEKYREDPKENLLRDIANIIKVKQQKFDDSNIIAGKVGNTTSTFNPDADVESTSVDGFIQNEAGGSPSWADKRDDAVGSGGNDNQAQQDFAESSDGGGVVTMNRGILLFDVSAIADGENVDSSVVSWFSDGTTVSDADTTSVVVTSAENIASDTAVTTGDFNAYAALTPNDAQKFGSILLSNVSTSDGGQNDVTMDSDGVSFIQTAIDGDNIVRFMFRNSSDTDNSAPTGTNRVRAKYAENGNSNVHPKLVVEHSEAEAVVTSQIIITD